MKTVTVWALMAAGACFILSGCGAPAIPTEPSIPVNETMREACTFADDAFIESIIIAADVDRMAGLSRQEAANQAEQGCIDAAGGDLDAATQCSNCFVTVIDEVYSQ